MHLKSENKKVMLSLYYENDCIKQYEDKDLNRGIAEVERIHKAEPNVLVELLDDDDDDRCIVGYN